MLRKLLTDSSLFRLGLLLLGVWLVCTPFRLHAQNIAYAQDSLYLSTDSLRLSHAFLVPFSEKVLDTQNQVLNNESYFIDYHRGVVVLSPATPEESYYIRYRYFLNPPKDTLSSLKPQIQQDTSKGPKFATYIAPTAAPEKSSIFWETSRIQKSGSITRGLSVGNARGASVTSGLRLQLEGDLGDGLMIKGAISDENIPIQPDGTTQQISDFDNIFIELSKGPGSLTLGDYELQQKDTRFANYLRNVQGLKVDYRHKQGRSSFSGSVAKGQFNTNSFVGREGVAGPYRLTGRNGERFFFVLAGSERVYLNGQLIKRGESNDYVIDYNAAEITFTAKHVITSITRIVVDFEYNDRNFNRSLFTANHQQSLLKDRLKFQFSYARDADNPNAPFEDPEAFEQVRDSLSRLGDRSGQATTSSVVEVGYDPDEVRYARIDTLIGGVNYERYVRSIDPQRAVFKIGFSFVGAGRGFYKRDVSGSNQVVFTWVAPNSAGIPQGDYAPIREWVLPKLLEVTNTRVQFKANKKLSLFSETSISRNDLNRLSTLNDEDNLGIAHFSGLRWEKIPLGDSSTLKWEGSYQYVSDTYQNLDRIYKAEYDRVWNLLPSTTRKNERIVQSSALINLKNRLQIKAEAGLRNHGIQDQASRQVITLQSTMKKFLQGEYTFTRITNREDSIQRVASWLRHEGDVYLRFGKWQSGVVLWLEDKQERRADTLSEGSLSFVDLKPYIKSVGNKKWQTELYVNYRFDEMYLQGKTRDRSRAYTYFFSTKWRPSRAFQIKNTSALRVFELLDTTFQAQGLADTRALNTQFQMNYRAPKRFLQTNWVYEVSAEQVARREIQYVEVNPGLGQYEWIDFNQNEIQELDEFQLSTNPLIANFVRVSVPSREQLPSTKLSLAGTFRWDFRPLVKKSKKPLKALIRNTRLNTNFRITQSKRRGDDLRSFLVDLTDIFADTTLLQANYNFRQDLTFFQNQALGDLKLSFTENQSKLFLETGEELRGLRTYGIQPRINFGKDKSLEIEYQQGEKFAEAPNFPTRNFSIKFYQIEPSFNLQLNRKLRFSLAYEHTERKNSDPLSGMESSASIDKAKLDTRINLKARNNIFSKLELVNIKQTGEANFSAAYELREGLNPGFNLIFQVFTTYYILSNVELGITYDARSARERGLTHTGRVQVRAFF